MMVVVVLINNCHVAEKPKAGPEIPQMRTSESARIVMTGLPAARVTFDENTSKKRFDFFLDKPEVREAFEDFFILHGN